MKKLTLAAASLVAMISATPAFAAELFNGGTPTFQTSRSAGSGVGQSIAVTTATTLTNIGFYSATPSGGNVKYLIFDASGANLLFSIASAATSSNTFALVKSPTFSFNLLAGSTYQFGIIADSSVLFGYDFPPTYASQNGLTSFGNNHNYSNYTSPAIQTDGVASIPLTLDGTQAVAAVPEPATWGMMLLGFGMVGFGMRYGVRRSNAKFDLKVKRIAAGLQV